MTELTPQNIDSIIRDCLYTSSELDGYEKGKPPEGAKLVEGITGKFGLHPGRLESHKVAIEEMIGQLPDDFKEGMSFLQACNNKKGEQWTGLHRDMELLFILGMAINKVTLLAPREVWRSLPGGMPYYQVIS